MQTSDLADAFAYEQLYCRFRDALLSAQVSGTRELTVAIKHFSAASTASATTFIATAGRIRSTWLTS